MRPADQLRQLAGGEVILQIHVEGGVVHGVYRIALIICKTIRRHKMELFYGKMFPHRVNIRFSVQLEHFFRSRKRPEGDRVDQPLRKQRVDITLLKTIADNAGVGHAVGDENHTADFGDAQGLP